MGTFCLMNAHHVTRLYGAAAAAAWGLGVSALPIAVAPPVSAQPCPDTQVVFARGTGEDPGVGPTGQAFVDALRDRLPGKSVDVYPVNYPASDQWSTGLDGIRDAGSHRDVFGKARRVGGREGEAIATAISTRGPADRTLGGDMQRLGRGPLDPPRDLFAARQRNAQARIGRQRPGPEAIGRQEVDLDVEGLGGGSERGQRPDDTVDLRMPGVSRD